MLLTDALSYVFSDEVSTIFLGALVDTLAPTGLAVTLLTSNDRDDVLPARDVAVDGAIVYSCRPSSAARATGWSAARSRSCTSIRSPSPVPRASTSTTEAALVPQPSM